SVWPANTVTGESVPRRAQRLVTPPEAIVSQRKPMASRRSASRVWQPASSGVTEGRLIRVCVRERTASVMAGTQQIVDAGLGARLRIHTLDDDGARQAMAAGCSRQAAGYDDRAGRYPAIQDFASGAVVDLCALAQEHSHGEHGITLDYDAIDHLRACADEAI